MTDEIRTQAVTNLASQISALSFVRSEMVKIQREFGSKSNAVFEGRDMGTVVFPHAELKIFLTAKPEVRADRRFRELVVKFPDLAQTLTREQILKEIEERDRNDSTRTVSPLRQAPDAFLIDTSDSNAEKVASRILSLYAKLGCRHRYPPMKGSYRLTYLLARFFFRIFYGLKVYGLSHFRPGSAVIAANHASFYDPPVISISCPEEVHFLARESLFDIPLLGRLIRILNSHPIARDASDAQTFRLLIQLLQSGKKLILFPEGQRTLDGEMLPFEKGLSFLVYKAKCGIIPVYVDGTFKAWSRLKRFPRFFTRIRCVFGTPIEWTEFEGLEKREAMDQITERTQQSLVELKQWLEKGVKGPVP